MHNSQPPRQTPLRWPSVTSLTGWGLRVAVCVLSSFDHFFALFVCKFIVFLKNLHQNDIENKWSKNRFKMPKIDEKKLKCRKIGRITGLL